MKVEIDEIELADGTPKIRMTITPDKSPDMRMEILFEPWEALTAFYDMFTAVLRLTIVSRNTPLLRGFFAGDVTMPDSTKTEVN